MVSFSGEYVRTELIALNDKKLTCCEIRVSHSQGTPAGAL